MAGVLSPSELALWNRMSGPDRRHSVAVARRVEAALPAVDRPLLAAALLHDVGKLESGLGTFGRVGATLVGLELGHARVAGWSGRRWVLGRVGRYACHDRLGADLLRAAGSDPLVSTWAEQHHLPSARWDLRADLGAVLKAADDD